jgi:hypothetical protein
MISHHNPYEPIFEELCDINDLRDDELIRDSVRLTRPYVQGLRKAYKNAPANVDYSCRHNRAAYMLAYYPHYIEVLHHILDDLPEDIINSIFGESHLRACFFGAGPGPEVLGWISYLEAHTPWVERATAYLFDKYADAWAICREITRYQLAPQYWSGGKLVTRCFECDLLKVQQHSDEDETFERAIRTSSLLVMQNCLNDIGARAQGRLYENLLWLFETMVPGSIFVMADLQFDSVFDVMCRIEETIVDSGLALALRSAKEGLTEFESQIDMHPIIAEELFTGKDGLIERRYTRFHSLVLARLDDEVEIAEDEIPF